MEGTAMNGQAYTARDRGRGAWQIRGSNYIISDLIIKGAHINNGKKAGESSGIRTRHAKNITIRNCLIEENDNGIVGNGEDIVYELCEIRRNGNLKGDRTHNVYNHGGTITIRYCHIYDPVEGQNIHMRAKNARIEYSLIENGYTYMGDLMSDKSDWVRGQPLKQVLTFIGNLIIEKESPLNDSKVFTMYNDKHFSGISMRINMFYNTFIGNGKNEALIQITNSGLEYQEAYLYNNIFYGNHRPFRIDISNQPDKFHVEAKNNWWAEGDYSQYEQFMSGSIFGTHPGFKDAKNKDFRLKTSAQAKNRANATLGEYPLFEYYLDENVVMKYKERHGANDLGAFESTKPN